MGLTQGLFQTHLQSWESFLGKTNRPHRKEWPSRLFRHEPIENAVDIIKSGQLLSRNGAVGSIKRDIAPGNILASSAFAQDYVRLYFRPKTPTQYRIEGIRKPNQYYEGKHAPVLIIFVFKSENLLLNANTMFSDGNMQAGQTVWGGDDAFFQSINFNHVFHEGAFDPSNPANSGIIRERCAEVLMPSPLQLDDALQAILCRSPAERATLLQLLGDDAAIWQNRIRVHSATGLFNSEYVYLDSVSLSNEGVAFKFHPPVAYQTVNTVVEITGIDNPLRLNLGPWELDPRKPWISKHPFQDGIYEVKFHLEGCLAYHSKQVIESMPY